MMNRLQIAKRLLREDGLIFIQINYKEMAYLRTLCDEIFDESNYINTVTIQTATTASFRAINDCPVNVSEFLLIYSRNRIYKDIKPVYRASEYSEDYGSYINNFEEQYSKWEIVTVDSIIYKQQNVLNWQEFKKKHGADWKKHRYQLKAEFCEKNANRIVSLNTMQKPSHEIYSMIEMSKKYRNKVFKVGTEHDKGTFVFNGRTLAFYGKKFREIDGIQTPSEILTNIWTDISFLSLGNEGDVDFPNGKKPEKLLKRILELSTNEGDIVLDFFAGTGTTGAVAHKMNRRYILCEQMDYIDSMTIARLNHVINGEEGGVSESLRWKGGGSFVYCALMERNEVMMSALQYSNTKEEALELLNQTMNHGLLKHSVIPNELRENMETISDMPIEQIKRFVKDLLDYNKLYVNLCDIDDEEMNVKPEDKAFTKSFYGIE